ncbi:carbohydrate ABC transporter permease [Treponema succinifaciens]|uniref:ABC-type transporter, integral membrane subunit n=1 Tax=Treponema succinifaciens (strain ATCC 33096 / DSM 2489 / 6091) TaxID=869209 RepID=F2NW30_TRES6|nr:sugar ABC transporter permease [Treponema succinifaciens]AEB14885.1 ABC-type transporter, integral membrane subunit [Treponema succinifaciens DSM 2489]MCI6913565.1 sugar ABC transporter permease [Treponema succinifaciens]MDY2615424.1 sugar ABC transporter permease [Treponema succinifaciens]
MKSKSLERKYKIAGWYFVMPASLLIFLFSFIPMVRAFILSLQSGVGNNLSFCGIKNYVRLFQDEKFIASLKNVIIYFAFQVPIMLFIAIILACILNDKKLKFKGLFRTIIFLPCATSLVASALIFKSLFALDGLVNVLLVNHHFISQPINWLTHPVWAKVIVIFTITWRWTGYNTVFFLAGLQGIEYSIYEAARIDGASTVQTFFRITLPQLKPVVLLTAIMSTNGTLQLFDEVKNLTGGGPGNATITISQYIYDLSFKYNPQFGYAAAVSYAILIIVALLSFIQIILADRKEK